MANHLIHPGFVGAYVYALTVDGVVRYIGKGRRYRATDHFRMARDINLRRSAGEKVRALRVHNKLAKALREGRNLDYTILANDLTDEAAYEMEKVEIAKAPKGQLWNLHCGGSGGDAEMMRALWADPAYRDRFKAGRTPMTDERRERGRAKAIEQWDDPEFRERWMGQHRALWDDPEAAAERRELLRRVWADPEKTARKRELVKSQWTPERRAAMAENRRKAWSDPEFKARATESIRRSREAPGFKELIAERTAANWKEPEVRERRTLAIREAASRRKK